eukprot:TRINITY_DN123834_c0_g1_i1.p1 TRINITY_DN123834_c0_g1~~TRINITY_DN123834_c0_g1_i1.p1  ORF type:complete len:305 (+),score=18.90 TRINITY_DN123834_c0_g1_i1:58-915(+)
MGLCSFLGDKVERARARAPPIEEFLRGDKNAERAEQNYGSTDSTTSVSLPSGSWKGYYNQYGRRWNVSTFELVFDAENRTVTGSGTDAIGRYSIDGKVSADGRRLAFSKQYHINTRADDGRLNFAENRGHVVHYRGASESGRLAQGYKGTWYIDIPDGYHGKGAFHLWPAMEGWQNLQPPTVRFRVSKDNICVICFSNPIDVCMVPCGHIAACSGCVRRMQALGSTQGSTARACPICRTPIQGLTNADGADTPCSDASVPSGRTPESKEQSAKVAEENDDGGVTP